MAVRHAWIGWAALALVAASAMAAEPPDAGKYVTREEYEAVKKELSALKAKLAEVDVKAGAQALSAEKLDALAKAIEDTKRFGPGSTMFILTGDAGAGMVNKRGAPNSFSAGFSPLLMWQVNDRLLLEAGLDFALANNPDGTNPHTDVDLSIADISYIICDYLTIGAGKFPVPFGTYHTRYDPRWINKLPDDPLVFGDRAIAPNTGVGVFANGAAPIKGTVLNYAVYATNGPNLVFNDPAAAGSLNFDNYNDINNNKAVGARVGWLPVPGLEFGYSFQFAHAEPPELFKQVKAFLQAVDVNYVRDCEALKGRVTARAEWVWSHVDEVTYDANGALGFGPLTFPNDRSGGYVLLAYRPTKAANKTLRNFEFVFRYDRIDVSKAAPGGGREDRWAPGVDYWITPSAVLKVAYEFDRMRGGPNDNALLFEIDVGF